jgi:DNA-binding NtrC family response regulator
MSTEGSDDATRTRHTPAPAPDDVPPHVLVVAAGSSSRVDLPRDGQVTIGRAPEVELHIDDDSVSRKHARLSTRAGEVSIADLDSHNGTRVNGEPLTAMRRLASGDVVQLGDVVLVVYGNAGRPAREVLDAERFRRRLDEEIERAATFDRELGVILLSERPDPATLRPVDLLGELGPLTALLVPELDGEAVLELARRCVAAAASPSAKAGTALCPLDGADAGALLAAARAALELAAPGAIVEGADAITKLETRDRTTLLADPAMIRLAALVKKLAASELSILVRGETGAGKEHIAHALHTLSPRAARPFVTLNCAAVQDTLVESELFGHEKGAFSGAVATKIGLLEAAHGGTVFLDEVGELTPAMQAKLLRALEAKRITRVGSVAEREIDIRVVAATHRDLVAESDAGRFRRDLFFRLGGATVVLPPLRERPREIALLARTFADEACGKARRPLARIAAGAMRALSAYAWPGNVRELKNVIEFVVATLGEDDELIEPWHLPPQVTGAAPPAAPSEKPAPAGPSFRPVAEELRELERRRMREALAAADGVQKRAAELIGMPLRTFHLKIKQYGLTVRRVTLSE